MASKNKVHERHHRIRPKLGKRNSWIQLWNALVPVYFVINYHDFKVVSFYNHSKIFQKLIQKSDMVKEILENSGKALGLALDVASLSIIDDFSASSIVMPEALSSWIPSILQLLLVVTLVISGYRMIGLVNALYASFDKDGELDGTEKTLITAMESILRFIITLLGLSSLLMRSVSTSIPSLPD